MNFIFVLHSHNRWLIAAAALLALVKFGWGWLKGGAFQKADKILLSAFSGLLDLQVTLGLIYLIWSSVLGVPFTPARIEHLSAMLLAAVVAHLPAMRKKADDAARFRIAFLAVAGALLLVLTGVMRLRGGWVW